MRPTLVPTLLLTMALAGCSMQQGRAPAAAGETITMDNLSFSKEVRQVPVGGRITFANSNGRALHVLVTGKDAQPRSTPGAPSFGGASGHRAETGDRWTTPPWTVAGTYYVTCTLHPSMNLKVVVA